MTRNILIDIIPPGPKAPESTSKTFSVIEEIKEASEIIAKANKSPKFLSRFGLLIFFIITISYFELIYGLWTFKSLHGDYVFPVLFAFPAAAAFFLVSLLFIEKVNKLIAVGITLLLILMYGTQLVYYYTFRTPLSLYSLIGTGDVLQFWDVALSAIFKNSIAILLLFVPLIFLILFNKKIQFSRVRPLALCAILFFGILTYAASILGVREAQGSHLSPYSLYYEIASPDLSIRKLGVLTTMRLDLERLIIGFDEKNGVEAGTLTHTEPRVDENELGVTASTTYNSTGLRVERSISNDKSKTLLDMDSYFSSLTPTNKNEYTGFFRGNNLILIIAESFSPYAISADLTPTLYSMSREGFVFNNFYNPVWGVSTSDGEYVIHTGLLPKSGVWSMFTSGDNYLPFTLGNQFRKLGYLTNAYHDHTYTYYGRDVSIPNLGYDYKGVGNGLKLKKTWPESDLEMIDVTTDEYINNLEPFHVYYLTVSGHMNYNFNGNYISVKNKALVDHLSYSLPAKAYISANLELEFAVKSLIQKLESAGKIDNTVIAIVPDHYPYGLPRESLDELAGHTLESNFELYKSIFILWKKGMESIPVERPASTLDILPTLSNLFGLEFDSLLLMGSDVFSDAPPLVIFLNRSWITDRERYNSTIASSDEARDIDYENTINKIVGDKFIYSRKILETNYYGTLK